MPNIVNATMYGTCAATDSPFATTTIEPITAKPKKTAKPIHGHRAGRISTRSADDDTEHLHGLLATLHHARADRLGLHVRRRGDGRRGSDDLSRLRLGLETLGDVHGVAHHGVLESPAAAHGPGDHRSRVHADPEAEYLHLRAPAQRVQLRLALLHAERAA